MTETEAFSKEAMIRIPLGHLLLAWYTLNTKLSDLQADERLSPEEKKSIWGLEDLLERSLIENGVTGLPQEEWAALIEEAKRFMNTVDVDFVD